MSEEQNQNRNAWAQLSQGDFLPPTQHQTYVREGYPLVQGYAHVQGYAPAEAQTDYSDYQNGTASHSSTHQNQGVNAYRADDDDIPKEEIHEFVSLQQQKRKPRSQAKPKADQPQSKRSERRARIAAENHGEVSATDKPKGLAEWREGVFQWWDPEDKQWLKAAYHDQYRDQFIIEDSTVGNYVVEPARGNGNDITTACSAFNQLLWRLEDRDSWDNIVDAQGNPILYMLNRPEIQSYDEPERLWFHDGCVLLDGDNNPVRPFAGIPRCFSSKIEGARIEALRRILRMTIQDFRARMLRSVPTATGTKPLSNPSTFGHRSTRFRALYQCPAWMPRAASAVLRKQVMDMLPESEEATSTAGLQVLSRYEVERRKSSTRGKYLYKAAGRAISDEERNRRAIKLERKLEREAAKQPQISQRPQSMPATPWQSASPSPYLPMRPFSADAKRHREGDGFEDFGASQPPPAKRGRLGASPLDPRLQGRFPSSPMVAEDPIRQMPESLPQQPEATDYRFVDPQDLHVLWETL